MKVINSNQLSKEDTKSLKNFYKFLLEPFRFGKGDEFKADIFRPDLLKEAINELPSNEAAVVNSALSGTKMKNNQKSLYWAAIGRLRSTEYRALYDYQLIEKMKRAEDYLNYKPSVVLGFIRLYDDFRSQNSPSKFNIGVIHSIIKISSYKNLLDLNYGLTDGTSFELRKVAFILKMSVDQCRQMKEESLQLLNQLYCY